MNAALLVAAGYEEVSSSPWQLYYRTSNSGGLKNDIDMPLVDVGSMSTHARVCVCATDNLHHIFHRQWIDISNHQNETREIFYP